MRLHGSFNLVTQRGRVGGLGRIRAHATLQVQRQVIGVELVGDLLQSRVDGGAGARSGRWLSEGTNGVGSPWVSASVGGLG